MIEKMNRLLKGKPFSLLDEIMVVPQEALGVVFGKIWRLRLAVAVLVVLCAALGMAGFKGQEAISRSLLLEKESRAKDATIEKLQKENKLLEKKLAFRRKVDDLVAKVQKEASWIDRGSVRSAVEKALLHTSDPALYLAIGLVEAGFRADVVHTDGVALGMHGLCPKDWHAFLKRKGIMESRDDYFDPVKSFQGSEAVLSALVRERGSLEEALLFYNGGVPAAEGRIPVSKTYAKRVLHLRDVFAAALQPEQAEQAVLN